MAEEKTLQGKQEKKWFGTTTPVLLLLAILGALIYGVTVFYNGYIQDIKRGENGVAAIQELDEIRSSVLEL